MCGLIIMDILLGKLRQHMAELSVQGDDFTRQMWQMYSAFEDFLEHQNESVEVAGVTDDENFLHRPSYPNQQRQRSSSTSAAVFRSYPPQMLLEDPSTTATNTTTGGGSSGVALAEHSMMVVDDYDLWSTMASVSRDQRTGTDIENEENYSDIDTNNNSNGNYDDDEEEDETDLIKQGIRNEMERRKLLLQLENEEMMMLASAEHDAAGTAEFHDRRRASHYTNLSMFSLPLQSSHLPPQQQKSLRRHRHCQRRRRLPATPVYLQFPITQQQQSNSYPHHSHIHSQFHNYQEFLDDKLTQSTPSVNVGDDGDDVNIEEENNECPQARQFGDSVIPYRRSSAPELLDNPLLETISTIEDLCESDDYGELPLSKQPAKTVRNTDKDMCQSKTTSAKCDIAAASSEDRAQQSSDGDRDSVGYAGSNSVDSGYKSSCPTPELLDPCYYAQGAICNGVTLPTTSSRRNTQMNKLSREPKQRTITMGTRAIRRQQQQQQQQQQCSTRPLPSPSSGRISVTSPLAETNSSSVGTGSETSSPSRNSTPAADATSTSGVSTNTGRSPSDYNYYDVNLDHLMYLRQSLLSAIQRCNNGIASENSTKSKENDDDGDVDDDFSLDSHSLAKLAANSKSWSSLDLRSQSPTPQTASTIERKSSFPHETAADILTNIELKLKNIRSSSMLADDESLRSSTERINSVASGDNAEYYDLESVKEFPCSYGTNNTMENRAARQPSIAKVKKLKDTIIEPNLTSFKNSQNVINKLCSTSSSIDLQQLPSNLECKETAKPMANSTRSSTKFHHISDPTCDIVSSRHQIRDDHRSIVKASIQPLQQSNQQQQQISQLQQRQSTQQQPQTMAKLKDEDPSVDKAKFSEVAICMLKIIEDIQHQQQQNQSSNVAQTVLKKISPTNIRQKKKTIQTRPLSPAIYDSQRLSGADYHLYEEITYDLALRPLGSLLNRDLPKMPPPLPARPNNIFGIQDIRQSCAINQSPMTPSNTIASLTTSTAEPKHSAAIRADDHGMKFHSNRARFHAPRRGNFYTLFTGQGHEGERRHLSRSLEREWWRENRSTTAANQPFDGVDDEYGFKVMIKPPSKRETKT
ncbi:hypothetical protein CHUAL_005357 [Chamberlinius hualienensis]